MDVYLVVKKVDDINHQSPLQSTIEHGLRAVPDVEISPILLSTRQSAMEVGRAVVVSAELESRKERDLNTFK